MPTFIVENNYEREDSHILGSINADHVISVPYFAKPGETLTGQKLSNFLWWQGGESSGGSCSLRGKG